jgi:hypothetical protein
VQVHSRKRKQTGGDEMKDTLKVVRIDTKDGMRFYGGYRADGFCNSGVVLMKTVRPCKKFSEDISKMACKQVSYIGYEAMVIGEAEAKRAYRKRGVSA